MTEESKETRTESNAPTSRKPYQRPVLTDYGDVVQLTASGTGGSADATMPMAT